VSVAIGKLLAVGTHEPVVIRIATRLRAAHGPALVGLVDVTFHFGVGGQRDRVGVGDGLLRSRVGGVALAVRAARVVGVRERSIQVGLIRSVSHKAPPLYSTDRSGANAGPMKCLLPALNRVTTAVVLTGTTNPTHSLMTYTKIARAAVLV
jgi:hypothetical protein